MSEKSINGPGVGLLGMRERARQLGGTLEIQSADGEGTRVFARLSISKGSGTANCAARS